MGEVSKGPTYGVLLVVLALVCVGGLWVGPGDLNDEGLRDALLSLRATRLAAAVLAGAALAAAGVVVQGVFRNPLASPSVLGTTAGATLGGQVALLLAGAFGLAVDPELIVPLGCLFGALLALGVLLSFVKVTRDLLALLLTGFILATVFMSLGGFLTSLAQESWELGRAVIAFSLGSVASAGTRQVLFALPLVVFGLVACWCWGTPLDLLLSGEEEAESLGVDVPRVRWWVATWASVLVAAAVSLGGNIAFVGLIVPHALRPFVGVGHRSLLLPSAIAGGVFVALCDLIARAIPSTTEVPLGVMTGLVGAPLFLALLLRARREEVVSGG